LQREAVGCNVFLANASGLGLKEAKELVESAGEVR
jgi:ribosomal protein L7/L12